MVRPTGTPRFIRRRPRNRYLLYQEPPIEQAGKYIKREELAEDTVLDQAVWSKGLPDDVFCTILARLPLSSFIRFRTVCKSWNAIVHDPLFLEASSRVSNRQTCLVLRSREQDVMYEPGTNNWLPIPASFFHAGNESHYGVIASCGGLVLLSHRCRLMLFNPLNKSKKNLPPMIDMDQSDLPTVSDVDVIGMYLEVEAKYISILVTDKITNAVTHSDEDDECDEYDESYYEGREPFAAQVYNSRTNSWEMRGTFDPEYQLSILNAALLDDTLHCLTEAADPNMSHIYNQLAIYSILKDIWDEDAIEMPDDERALVSPHLFTNTGRLLLVAARTITGGPWNNELPLWNNIIIWELQAVEPEVFQFVRKLEIEPQEVQKELLNIRVGDLFFLSEGDFVYFGSKLGSTLGMINVKSQTWRLLPPIPDYDHYDFRSQPKKFLFQPRIDLEA
ncbi:hypothetical protein AXG93_242s1130 [Marchantia polymorpha subsp. ruderalis]|uniref:F-box domain-containing protein n=2 Tax=Marchantia polymorpha TaxID=3197 RepID=A0A176VNQ8_MARPO|nr:hypothetical protein AXG93_242s1130 [Marchantia polymorpha subsp. ruderalis]